MHVHRVSLAALAVIFLGSAAGTMRPASNGGTPAPGLAVGRPFPPLVLPALDGGRPRSIAEFRGRRVLLHIFASW